MAWPRDPIAFSVRSFFVPELEGSLSDCFVDAAINT